MTHPTYLVTHGSSDIFFPTDFSFLKVMYDATTGGYSEVVKHKNFVSRYGEPGRTVTQTGYNPFLKDYVNMSVLTTDLPVLDTLGSDSEGEDGSDGEDAEERYYRYGRMRRNGIVINVKNV